MAEERSDIKKICASLVYDVRIAKCYNEVEVKEGARLRMSEF